MKELLIGCGSTTDKRLALKGNAGWNNLVTLDINPDHNPDVVWDLETLPLPFADNEFDEIHAYEVLEHTGSQGDYKFFFAQFSEFWRILNKDGVLFVTCPLWNGKWAWGDPSHKRVLQLENLAFLIQPEYERQVGVTSMTDFRYIYKADFDVLFYNEVPDGMQFGLKAVKPSRIKGKQ